MSENSMQPSIKSVVMFGFLLSVSLLCVCYCIKLCCCDERGVSSSDPVGGLRTPLNDEDSDPNRTGPAARGLGQLLWGDSSLRLSRRDDSSRRSAESSCIDPDV